MGIGVKNEEKIESLQVVRAIAFLCIFLSHCHISSPGPWGVSVFFALSGFLLVIRKKNTTIEPTLYMGMHFAINKTKKLYGLYFITMIASLINGAIFHFSLTDKYIGKNICRLLLNSVLLQSWVPHSDFYFALNSVSWFMSTLFFLYIIFPFFLRMIQKITTIRTNLFLIMLVFLAQIVVAYISSIIDVQSSVSDNFVKWITYICPAYRLGDFCMGGLLGNIYIFSQEQTKGKYAKNKKNKVWFTLLEIIAIALNVLIMVIYYNGIGNYKIVSWIKLTTLFVPGTLVLIWVFARQVGYISTIMRRPVLLFLGDISSYAFLTHLVIIHFFESITNTYLKTTVSPWAEVFIVLFLTIFISEGYNIIHMPKATKSNVIL